MAAAASLERLETDTDKVAAETAADNRMAVVETSVHNVADVDHKVPVDSHTVADTHIVEEDAWSGFDTVACTNSNHHLPVGGCCYHGEC